MASHSGVSKEELEATVRSLREEMKGADDALESQFQDLVEELQGRTSEAEALATRLGAEAGAKFKTMRTDLRHLRHHIFLERELSELTTPYTLATVMGKVSDRLGQAGIRGLLQNGIGRVVSSPHDQPLARSAVLPPDGPTQEQALGLAIDLRNAVALHRAAQSAPLVTRPIMEYYSAQQLARFFSNLLFTYPDRAFSHGLKFAIRNARGNDQFVVTAKKGGLFRRLADALALIGLPNDACAFALRGVDPASVDLVGLSGTGTLTPGKEVDLESLLKVDCNGLDLIDEYGTVHGGEALDGFRRTSQVLVHYASIYAASNLARYYPAKWQSILDGRHTEEIKHYYTAATGLSEMFEFCLEWVGHLVQGELCRGLEPPLLNLTRGALP